MALVMNKSNDSSHPGAVSQKLSTGTAPLSGWVAVLVLAAWCLTGCGDRDVVQVKLQSRSLPEESPVFLHVEAQVAGPTEGLRYKWFAVSGECEPQESDKPDTVFKFHEGVRQDRVTVEVWRNDQRVAQNEIKVKFDEEKARRVQMHSSDIQIEITNIPPSEPGGPNTRANIGGNVTGKASPDYLIAIYVRASGAWYVQPEAGSLIQIRPDNSWETWTHTGTKYAALLVRSDYEPLTRLDMLPETNESILSLTIVDGLTEQRFTNAEVHMDPVSR
jgi:hypothetical protein